MREKEKKKERDKDKDQAKEKEKEREKKKHKLVNEIKRENGEVKLLQKGESQMSECARSKGVYTPGAEISDLYMFTLRCGQTFTQVNVMAILNGWLFINGSICKWLHFPVIPVYIRSTLSSWDFPITLCVSLSSECCQSNPTSCRKS